MSVITEKDFEFHSPEWVNDPTISPEQKKQLFDLGVGESIAGIEGVILDSRCFFCGDVLEVPYVYWHGCGCVVEDVGKGISLHAKCAKDLAERITKDAMTIENE